MILSRFRKKKTTIEILENLDSKIKEIERYGYTTEQKHKRIVGTLILYSVILYIITTLIFYFYFFPASLYDQIFYIIPLLIFPILILLTKKMVTWYYKRKISENQEKLCNMQLEKKKILEEVTETETYKKAKEILLKFAPDQLRMTPLSPQSVTKVSPVPNVTPIGYNKLQGISPAPSSGDLRRRIIPRQPVNIMMQSATPINTGAMARSTPNPQHTPFQSAMKPINSPFMGQRLLPRPILPQQRSYLDRLIDALVGDGPSNRYALICRHCESHNGMALKEEFEYFGFRCCYCNFWNPARKQKPFTPKIEDVSFNNQSVIISELESTPPGEEQLEEDGQEKAAKSPFDSESDTEVVERPTEPSDETTSVPEEPIKEIHDEPDAEESERKEVQESEESVEKMDIDDSSS